MLTKDLEYILPNELIAYYPQEKRGDSRLLVIDREKKSISHDKYSNVYKYLNKNDVVVVNNTKVINARLFFKDSSEKEFEVLFLNKAFGKNRWEVIILKSRKLKNNEILFLTNETNISIKVQERVDGAVWLVEVPQNIYEIFDKYGHVPLPPYIKRPDNPSDKVRYNTVFGTNLGSVAAPTSSLNLTKEIFDNFKKNLIQIAEVTLDVGWGTFAPIRDEIVENHHIHTEKISIDTNNAQIINKARKKNGKVLAFGTTSARTIESVAGKIPNFELSEFSGETDLYIYPGYKWKIVDLLLTNFHAPRTSLLALVASFAGYELIMEAYNIAIKDKYRFLSYGDSMLIL